MNELKMKYEIGASVHCSEITSTEKVALNYAKEINI